MRLDHAHWTVFDFLASKSDRVLATCCVIEIVAAENLNADKPGAQLRKTVARHSGSRVAQEKSERKMQQWTRRSPIPWASERG
jgi:hypothetical protein